MWERVLEMVGGIGCCDDDRLGWSIEDAWI